MVELKKVNAELIHEKMAEQKLTLQNMSEALGYKHASTFSKYLNGDLKWKAQHLPILSQKLGIPMEQLFFEV